MFGPLKSERTDWKLLLAEGWLPISEPQDRFKELRAVTKIHRKLWVSIWIYLHCRHCRASGRSQQWKHWNTGRDGKCWQLHTLDLGPRCHSLSQTLWQGGNLKLLPLGSLFLCPALSPAAPAGRGLDPAGQSNNLVQSFFTYTISLWD